MWVDLNENNENGSNDTSNYGRTDPAWIPAELINGWTPFPGYDVPSYRKINGLVYLRGGAQLGTGISMFFLPEEYRAAFPANYVVRVTSAGYFGNLYIGANGEVSISGEQLSIAQLSQFVSFAGIVFDPIPVEPVAGLTISRLSPTSGLPNVSQVLDIYGTGFLPSYVDANISYSTVGASANDDWFGIGNSVIYFDSTHLQVPDFWPSSGEYLIYVENIINPGSIHERSNLVSWMAGTRER